VQVKSSGLLVLSIALGNDFLAARLAGRREADVALVELRIVFLQFLETHTVVSVLGCNDSHSVIVYGRRINRQPFATAFSCGSFTGADSLSIVGLSIVGQLKIRGRNANNTIEECNNILFENLQCVG